MSGKLSIRYFAHSWLSDWNHGNAHFLRGLMNAVARMGHEVRCYEPLGGWSLSNLVNQEPVMAAAAMEEFRLRFPGLDVRLYQPGAGFRGYAERELRGADIVILHEWNEPEVINTVLALKPRLGFRALFHDTHHRAYTRAHDILRFHLHLVDGVLAFGEAIRTIYADGFGVPRTWTFHEAADTDNFRPIATKREIDVLWIGNWGDDERTRELQEFLIEPAGVMRDRHWVVHGVRYPDSALAALQSAGIDYCGYLPNLRSPGVYCASRVALHVPRRQYANGLSGIPTIRVFEALACGVPLICSPWTDLEGLFRPGFDYFVVKDGGEMRAQVRHLLTDEAARRQMAANGLARIRERHTCRHRALQLVDICEELGR